MESFSDLTKRRESVRKYLDKPVEREKLEACIEAARLAPSACNSQPWHFIIVDDPEKRDRIAGATHGPLARFNEFTHQAAAMVVVVMEPGNFSSRLGTKMTDTDFALIDMGMAVEHFCLQAAELGLGTCIIGWSRSEKIKEVLKIPKNKKIGLLISVGYPVSTQPRSKQRKAQIHSYNGYHDDSAM